MIGLASARRRFGPLWDRRDFRLLFVGETLSAFGSAIGGMAFVIVAALVVRVTPAEMGLIFICGAVPPTLIGLVAGAWIDRLRRRPVLITLNLVLAATTTLTAFGAIAGILNVPILLVLAVVFGVVEAFMRPAYEAFLPTIVEREELVEANGRLELGHSAAETVGPAIGGLIVQALTAPVGMLLDSLSYLAAAVGLRRMSAERDKPSERSVRRDIAFEVRDGLGRIASDRRLLTIALVQLLAMFAGALVYTNYVLYVGAVLGDAAPTGLGFLWALGGLGFLVGAGSGPWLFRRLGLGRTVVLGATLVAVSPWFMPLAPASAPLLAFALLAASSVVGAVGDVVMGIQLSSLNQAITPNAFLGRVSSALTVARSGALLAGAAVGGALGSAVGLRDAILVSCVLHLVPYGIIIASPIRALHSLPAVAGDTAEAVAAVPIGPPA